MNKIPLFLMFISSFAWAQQDFLNEKIKGKVKSIERKIYQVKEEIQATNHIYYYTIIYGKNALISKIKTMGNDEKMDSEELFTFNHQNKIETIETIRLDGSIYKTMAYVYNSSGNLISEKKMNYKYDIENESTYNYNNKGQLVSKNQTFLNIDHTIVESFYYNHKQQLIEVTKKNLNDLTREVFAYNNLGYVSEKVEYNSKNEKYNTTLYEYNDYGDKTSLFILDPIGEMTYFEQHEYTYDSQGNWIEKRSYVKGDYISLEKRKIVYY